MSRSKSKTLRLPTDSDGEIDTDSIDTDEILCEELDEYDIIIDKDEEYVALVVADPIRDIGGGHTVIRAPVIGYRAYSNLLDELGSASPVPETSALEMLRSAAINTYLERRDPKETVTIVSDSSRGHFRKSGGHMF